MCCRMVIGETISSEQLREFVSIFKEEIQPSLGKEEGSLEANVLREEGGNMVIVLTRWTSRESCLKHHSSRSYQNFVMRTQHLPLGNFVVKLFLTE